MHLLHPGTVTKQPEIQPIDKKSLYVPVCTRCYSRISSNIPVLQSVSQSRRAFFTSFGRLCGSLIDCFVVIYTVNFNVPLRQKKLRLRRAVLRIWKWEGTFPAMNQWHRPHTDILMTDAHTGFHWRKRRRIVWSKISRRTATSTALLLFSMD